MSVLTNILRKKLIDILLIDAKKAYIKNLAENTKYDLKTIKELMKKFEIIQNNVLCAHNDFEFLIMYAMILKLPIDGPMVELGSYKGGSTAKLSLICNLTRRKLYVFDSFEGLPAPKEIDNKHKIIPWISSQKEIKYKKGAYYGSLSEVKKNVEKYGKIDVCEFIKGKFEQTLPSFDDRPACIFMDVDLIDSALNILKYLWPKLLPNGILFTHETKNIDFIEALTSKIWWEKELKERSPLLYGAGYGASWRWRNISFPSNIAYFLK